MVFTCIFNILKVYQNKAGPKTLRKVAAKKMMSAHCVKYLAQKCILPFDVPNVSKVDFEATISRELVLAT